MEDSKKYTRKFFGSSSVVQDDCKPGVGQFKYKRAHSDIQGNVFRPSVSTPLRARVVVSPLEAGKGRDVCLYVHRENHGSHPLPPWHWLTKQHIQTSPCKTVQKDDVDITGGNTLSMLKGWYLKENVLLVCTAYYKRWSPFSFWTRLLPPSCFFPHSKCEQKGALEIKNSILISQMKAFQITLLVSEIR